MLCLSIFDAVGKKSCPRKRARSTGQNGASSTAKPTTKAIIYNSESLFIDYGDGFLVDTNVFPVDGDVEGFYVDTHCFYINPTGIKRRRLECSTLTVEEETNSSAVEVVEIEMEQEKDEGGLSEIVRGIRMASL